MVELGYQAGQHELLADELQKKYPPEIKNSIKDILKVVDNIKKELKCQQSSLEKSYKVLEKSKSKYSKVQDDFNSSKETFSKLISTEINDRTKQVQKLTPWKHLLKQYFLCRIFNTKNNKLKIKR